LTDNRIKKIQIILLSGQKYFINFKLINFRSMEVANNETSSQV